MKVSIITVCFNSEVTIQDTISSVATQDYSDIEYILIDGGSSDSTVEIIKNNSQTITKFISEPDNGLYDAMNKGIGLSSGDIIGFINSDDMLNGHECISEIVRVFSKNNSKIVYGDVVFVDPKDTSKIQRYWKAGSFNIDSYKNGWMTPHLSTYIKKSVYDNFGLFNTNFKIAADYELMLRFIVKNKIIPEYLPITIARMRSGGVSNSSLLNILKSNIEVYKSWKANSLNVSILIILIKPFKKIAQFWSTNT